jgi:hypothetical protein
MHRQLVIGLHAWRAVRSKWRGGGNGYHGNPQPAIAHLPLLGSSSLSPQCRRRLSLEKEKALLRVNVTAAYCLLATQKRTRSNDFINPSEIQANNATWCDKRRCLSSSSGTELVGRLPVSAPAPPLPSPGERTRPQPGGSNPNVGINQYQPQSRVAARR